MKIVPEHMAYYIDCNSPKSPAYASVDAYADLLNEVPDQAYEKMLGAMWKLMVHTIRTNQI